MNLKDHFPRASQSFVAANPQLIAPTTASSIPKTPKRGRMNKTEAEFALILEAMKRKGEILRYEFEGVTLRFANVKYTPDFVVFKAFSHPSSSQTGRVDFYICTTFYEVKGPFIRGNRERAIERFRHAKTYWPEFAFELHQKTKEGWKQLI